MKKYLPIAGNISLFLLLFLVVRQAEYNYLDVWWLIPLLFIIETGARHDSKHNQKTR